MSASGLEYVVVERALRVNLIALIGVAVVAVSFAVPAFSVSYPTHAEWNSDFTIVDIVRGDVSGWFGDEALGAFIALTLVGSIVSIVSPLGGYAMLFGSLATLYRIPYLWSFRDMVPGPYTYRYVLEPGVYLAVLGSAIVLFSLFARLVYIKRSVQIEYGLTNVTAGFLTISYGDLFPRLHPRVGSRFSPNLACMIGVALGLVALALSWYDRYIPRGASPAGLSVLLGNVTIASLGDSLQIIMIFYLIGLVSSLYTPLGASVQMTSALAFLFSTGELYQEGLWLGIVSSAVIIHSLLMPSRDADGQQRLAIVENLRTFRRV
jgi:hypothetical protein